MENRKDKLRMYLAEQQEKPLPKLTDRGILLPLGNDLIIDVIGPRRAGKTSLLQFTMQQLLQTVDRSAVVYLNFESRRLFPITLDYFNDLIELFYEQDLFKKHRRIYLLLDEVQKIPGWEQYIRSIHDEWKEKIKIIVSGSSSQLTKSTFSHLLTGRHLTIFVPPLSFMEFLSFKNFQYQGAMTEEKKAKIEQQLQQYLSIGGFPEVVLTGNTELAETLFLDILNRDITAKVRHKEIIEDIAYFLCSYVGKLTSFSKLSKILKNRGLSISVPTLEKYFWLMKESFLFFDIQIFSYKMKDQLQYPRKVYCVDTGLVNYFGFRFSEDRGRIMENCVAVELMRMCFANKKRKLFYWKSKEGAEVDFVIKEGVKISTLIQVCYAVTNPDIKKRELGSLLKASMELKCNTLVIVTWDQEGSERVQNKHVTYIPLWKWLLKERIGQRKPQVF